MKYQAVRDFEPLSIERRELLKLLAIGGVVSASGLAGCAAGPSAPAVRAPAGAARPSAPGVREDFVFLQLSDIHWGYSGPNNPEASHTFRDVIAAINASPVELDFVVFTGDLTQTTDDGAVRRRRMKEFQGIVADLRVKTRYYLPGEHDAGPDGGEAYRELFGETHGSFDHKGIHFVRLDNVSAPGSVVGDAQLGWLAQDLASVSVDTPVVVLAHRPLFELFPAWDWTTADGARVLELLAKHAQVSVFYGHIHQEHHHTTGHIVHHAARSLVFPLPAPGSLPKKAPLPWDPQSSDHGLGYRRVAEVGGEPSLAEIPFDPRAWSAP
jgi:hypothetical protein